MSGERASLEELASRAGERALDKQERLLEELRSRTGLVAMVSDTVL